MGFSVGIWSWNVPYTRPEWWIPVVGRIAGIGSSEMGHERDTIEFLQMCKVLDVAANLWEYQQMTPGMWAAVAKVTGVGGDLDAAQQPPQL